MKGYERGDEVKLGAVMLHYLPPDEGITMYPYRAMSIEDGFKYIAWGRTPGEALDRWLGMERVPAEKEGEDSE